MLHEEARASVGALDDDSLRIEADEVTGRSYDFDGESLSYAVATKLLPKRLWAVWGILAVGLAIVAGLAVLDSHAATASRWLGIAALPAANWSAPVSLGAWFSNLTLTVAALLCLLIFGLRRHRLDDYRGKYRRWLGAAALLAVASLILSTGLHKSLAESLATATGITALPNNAIWWLIPTALVGGWVSARIALDMRPCRLGLFALAAALGFYFTSLAAHFALMPTAVAEVLTQPAAQCAGHLWLLTALLAQIRFIQLEADGVIPSPIVATAKAKLTAQETEKRAPQHQPAKSNTPEERNVSSARAPENSSPAQSSTHWIDGRNSRDRDAEEDRPLSKAERKRLRREARNRAA